MVNISSFDNNLDSHLKYIRKLLKELEEISEFKNIRNTGEYIKWQKCFTQIYGKESTNLRLYLLLGLIYCIGYFFILKFILSEKSFAHLEKFTIEKFEVVRKKIKTEYQKDIFLSDDYFIPFFEILEELTNVTYEDFLTFIERDLFSLKIPQEYFFNVIIQKFISGLIRHKSGEYYTPMFLTKKMVDSTYRFGDFVLDPSCGTANFLIEILKSILYSNKTENEKNLAISRLYGYDINPISIFIAKLNFFLLLRIKISIIKLNLFVKDSLFLEKDSNSGERFDLVIGNPPWYTLRDIGSIIYQNKIKDLAEKLNIKPSPKNVLNIEISSLFFYKAKSYMKKNAKIFFVITKGIINGSHASRFRNFYGFKNLEIWKFDSKIEKIFNIDFICLYAENSNSEAVNEPLEIPVYYFGIKRNANITYFQDFKLRFKNVENFIPYHIERKGNKTYVQKLVSKGEFRNLLPFKPSDYKKLFHKGADLNPRNLIFVQCEKLNDSLVKINPDPNIFKRAKSPWNDFEFKDEVIENDNIFKVVKSTELVRFLVYNFYYVFLPLSKKDLSFNYDRLSENSKAFYDKINQIYLNYKKETTNNNSLMDNLNRWSKLINSRQKAKIKVVYNNSGSVLNSAIIQGDYIITGDLSFYDAKSLEEAYYLTAILNSPLINNQVRIKKSTRHIFKIPFECPIKKFNINDKNHNIIANLGKKGQLIAESTFNNIIKTTHQIPSKIKLQKIIEKELKPILTKIDNFVIKEFQS
ncbi:MAG: N-6 DNA methylase [Promethearchaeota archaeon]